MTPNAIPLSRANAFSQITTALDQAGVSPERLTRRLNMPNWQHSRSDDFVPMEHDYRLLHFGAKAAGDPLFGATVLEHVPIQHRGLLCTHIQKAPNLYQSLHAFVRAVSFYGTSRRWWLAEHRDDIWLFRGGSLVFELGEVEMEQLALVAMVQVIRMAAGPNWRPGKIRVQISDNLGLANKEIFASAEIFLDVTGCAIAIPRSILSSRLQRNTAHSRSNAAGCHQESRPIAPASDFAGSLRQVVATLLRDGYPGIEVAAEIAGLNLRSLQRRLESQGVTYRQLVDQARFDLASQSLRQSHISVTDIAFDVGYSDVAHFTRAFRRWAGVSPREYRRYHAIA